MLLQVISLLTAEQKHALDTQGVDRHLLSHWKNGKRLPTEPQAVILAAVAGIDLAELQAEIAIRRSSEVQRPLVERYLKRIRGAVAMLAYGLTVAAPLAGNAGVKNATMYKKDRRRGDRRYAPTAH